MFNLKKLFTPRETILWKSSLHWILIVKGGVCFAFTFLLSLYLPCLFWNDQIPNFALGIDFLFDGLFGFYGLSIWAQATIIAMVMMIAAGVVVWIFYITKYISSVVIITENRLIYKTGIVFVHIEEIEIDEIEEVHINTGVLGRLFNYAYIYVDMRFVGEKMIPMVAKPYTLVTYLHRSHDKSENKLVEILDKK